MRRSVFTLAQAAAAAVTLTRLSRGRSRRPPLSAEGAPPPEGEVSVVIPARDEAARIGPCLEGLRGDRDVSEVVVVDDRSSDGTADVAAAAGARVVAGAPLPEGWVGKPWALQQGLEAARGEWVVTLDADTRPQPGLVRALVAELESGADLISAGSRFVCDTVGERLVHPSMLVTLIYRCGPADAEPPPPPERLLVNGQCLAFRREELLAAGGFSRAATHMTDDVALGRGLARDGWAVRFRDSGGMLDVRMHESGAEVWREWGRSLAMPDVTDPGRQALDLAVVWLVLAAPLPRLLGRRASPLDGLLLAVRLAMLVATRDSYPKRGVPYWLSFLADAPVAARLTWSALRPTRTWRGRTY
jgi:dolichol-phosphate mannosyltransferase